MASFRSFLFTITLIASIASCSLTNVGRYDPVIDQTVTELQQKLTRFFVSAETEAGTPDFAFANFNDFYKDIRVQAESLRIRSAARNEGSIADREVILLDENIKKLQQLHKIGINSPEEVALLKSAFDQQFTAILKLQLGLKERRK